MRNVSIASTRFWELPFAHPSNVTFDAELDCIYVLSEKHETPLEVEVGIFLIKRDQPAEEFPTPLASFIVPCYNESKKGESQIVSFHFLSETRSLVLITSVGDIGLFPVDGAENAQFDVIGSIDAGIAEASWSPDDVLVSIVSGDSKLLVMNNSFDTVFEGPLSVSDKGLAQQVSVGWGTKQTQFHGLLGKAAAQEGPVALDAVGSSPDDDERARISWRGDCAFFAVSSVEYPPPGSNLRKHRVIRVYDRQGVLQNTSESVPGLEHVLSWRPSGNLIVSAQRFGFEGGGIGRAGRHDVVFFERNGLRHGEFGLRENGKGKEDSVTRQWGYRIKEAFWSVDSNILALWIERDEGDLIQLWMTGNYHWYLKQEILSSGRDNEQKRFLSVRWHPEDPLRIVYTTSTRIYEYKWALEIYISREQAPLDSGTVAVVDGASILITPFRTQNVPPPMSSCKLDIDDPTSDLYANGLRSSRAPIHVAFSPSGTHMGLLRCSGAVQLWNLHTRIEIGRSKAVDPELVREIDTKPSIECLEPRQMCLWESQDQPDKTFIACLTSTSDEDVVFVFDYPERDAQEKIVLLGRDGRLLYSQYRLYWQSSDGSIYDALTINENPEPVTRFPGFCFYADCISLPDNSRLFVGRSESGKLYCATDNAEQRAYTLAANTTSFIVAAGFIIYITTSHEALFAPIEQVRKIFPPTERAGEDPQWERRRVERGSRIVTAVPSMMNLILQMPRGNLETINPRPLVMMVVRHDIDTKNYRKAFGACRKHRIDLTTLITHDSDSFLKNVGSFVEQIDDVDYFNLLLTNLGQSPIDPSKVSEYCDAIRMQLEVRDLKKYVNAILTAYVVKKPADYEAGLSVLLRLREINPELVEEAVKYIIFLVDAERLFNTALGMYDFSLVLLIAQHSQRDPREYLPFLRQLRALPKFYQRHKIDDHLKRYSNAIKNLYLSGSEYFEEALAYIESHQLHREALALWKENDEQYKRVLDLYGGHLFEHREFRQAAIVFMDAQDFEKAMVAYERALLWRELFTLALQQRMDEGNMVEIAHRVAEELLSKKRYDEASQVLLDYARNVRQSVIALAQGSLFSEALRQISLHGVSELIEEIIHPAALDSRTQIAEDIEEMRTQLEKQVLRLRELRLKKVEEPDEFYGVAEDSTLQDVDVMTDVSMAPTAFTRYTVAPTTTSKASRRTSRSKRKMERKLGSGRKGTIDEEEYLLKSIGKLTSRFVMTQDEAAPLILHLMQFTSQHREEARSLQDEVVAFHFQLSAALDEIWPVKAGKVGELNPTSWSERIEEKKRERKYAVESIEKPDIGTKEPAWRVELLDI